MSNPSESLRSLLDSIFSDVSMVLHAGDLTRISILEAFAGKDVVAVCGNMDRHDVTQTLPVKEIINIHGHRIGLIHGWGSAKGVEARVRSEFQGVDAIVYGHTHKAVNRVKDGVLMFNPGAFSGTFPFGRNRSVGLLTIDDGICGSIVHL
ncbi:MAG: metallophosphoesterase family protein [Desulfobacterales bacterium]|nr:MAG: metallophosphoesterase family protein [Desulfobacterales bacterium]UCD89561.1 MAG: metallophosphoesterase family protein [Desulfobacterales bacterium]